MTALQLLETLQSRGVTVRADGETLRIKPVRLVRDLDSEIKANKAQLLEMLKRPAQSTLTSLDAFLLAVEAHRHPTIPGLIILSSGLAELLREAEAECGHALTFKGTHRRAPGEPIQRTRSGYPTTVSTVALLRENEITVQNETKESEVTP